MTASSNPNQPHHPDHHDHEHSHSHGDHDHDHDHDEHGGHHTWVAPSIIEARVRALESLLVEKGLTTHDAIDTLISAFENDLGPMHGARVDRPRLS